MDFEVSEDIRLMTDTVRRFVQKELQPIGLQIEQEDHIPEEIVQTMRELGLFGLASRRNTAAWA